ncbi:response regulator transcription factor [Priestia filamentosa]|uniref:response regulator transcription factor n=1 Tax=Priestia filamentosa TaxID=1402861 RepID=UPI000E739E01|nr:response regulator transcription factor [Priestia filamentosa]RJS62934.1 DNA-binding response regulator [Priestia filamentosa]
MREKILIVDDEEEIADLLEDFLTVEGYKVYKATTGEKAQEILFNTDINFVLLDIMMPGESGFTLCKQLRKTYDIPIVFLSALQDHTDKIRGLNIGADDYIVKDSTPGEIIARIKAIQRRIRRSNFQEPQNTPLDIMKFENVKLNLLTRFLIIDNKKITLTSKEFDIIKYFLNHIEQVLTYNQILEKIWGYEQGDFHTIRVHIAKLRDKIEKETDRVRISTVWGIGYKIERKNDE